jgi:hypothetical protein
LLEEAKSKAGKIGENVRELIEKYNQQVMAPAA